MRKNLMTLWLCLLLFAGIASGQTRMVSGLVISADDNQPIPGASVFVDGTSIGTVTDAEGHYSLNVRQGKVLRITFFGMKDVFVDITGKDIVNVTMESDALGLDEVVVTASGMTRQEKTLGYASTTVRADQLNKGHATDALSGLAGKVAGMQISSSGGTGTSQKVIVRGYSSLSGSNQPLYVVDGVPVTNVTMGSQGLNNSIDFGNSAADINPEDISSVTVLKGASATALYGSRAANGVIVITTKKGAQNESVKVTYDGAFTAQTVLRIPQLQNKFGQGWFYSYNQNFFENYSYTENGSWGNILDGREVEWRPGASWYNGADPSYTKYAYKKNSLKNFYETGFEMSHNITIQGGSKTTGFIASYGNVYSDGILPGSNDYYKRNNFSFRGNTKMLDGLVWFNYGVSYVRKDIRNAMSGQGSNGSTIYQDILQYPVNIDYADLKDYNSVYNNADNYYTPYAMNPFWILDHNYSVYQDDRVYGNVEVGIQLVKGLQLIGRGGLDVINSVQKSYNDIWRFSDSSYAADEGASAEIGSYNQSAYKSTQIDANVFLNADYKLPANISVHGVAGLNVNQRSAESLAGTASNLAISGYPSLNNVQSADAVAGSESSKRRLAGLYAQVDLGWKDAIYLTLSARNDWSSTLPKENRSFFYYGVNGSVILTELIPGLKNKVINFAKLRAGYGQTGNDASPYLTSAYYFLASSSGGFGSVTFPLGGYSGFSQSAQLPSTDLQPEISTEAEIGADIRLFNNRLGVDFAYYNKKTENQIISSSMAPESGYTTRVRNVGCIRNKGFEVSVNAVPVRVKDFSWDLTWTFAKNKNKVESLWDDVQETTIYGLTSGPQLKAIVGKSLGTWTDYAIETVTDKSSPYYGYTVVDSKTGYPEMSSSEVEVLGYADPKFTMGLTNTFSFRNMSLGFTLDWRHGGLMYSATNSIVYFNGNAEETMYNMRDAWIWPKSVIANADGTYSENNVPVDNYYSMNGVWYSNYNYVRYRDELVDKSYLKLREVNFTYRFPSKWFKDVKWLSGASLSLIGRNLLMWTPNQGIIDPDTTNYGNDLTSQFGEYYSAPSTRSFGGSVKITF